MGMVAFWLLSAVLVILAVAPFYIRSFGLLAGNPANPHQFGLLEFFSNFVFWRSENYLWLLVAVVGGTVTIWTVLTRRYSILAEVVTALLIACLLGFAFLSEIRIAHLMQVSLLLSVGVLIALVSDRAASWFARYSRRTVQTVAVALFVVFICGVLAFGQNRAQVAFDWFRVVDAQVLASLDWIRNRGTPGDVVVANEAPHGGILGWWVEGYAELPAYLAVDPRWLSFRDEKLQAEVAHRFLAPGTDPAALQGLADRYEVRFVLLHKETLHNPLSGLLEAGFVSSMENEDTIILEYTGMRYAR
jgi:hypothetical protein